MTTPALLAVCVALDDDQPDDVCPGCGQDITGWQGQDAHYPPGVEPVRLGSWELGHRAAPMPFAPAHHRPGPDVCEWTGDYLAARAIRRRLIAEGVT